MATQAPRPGPDGRRHPGDDGAPAEAAAPQVTPPPAPAPPRTVACQDRDFVEWHGGCRQALVWAALVDTDGVREAVAAARGRLADVLLPRYERRPHVTIAYAGLLPTPGATPAEQPYGPDRLARDILTLRRLAARPFRVQVGGWGSFPMVPYLSAGAPELHRAHAALGGGSTVETYVPHVTVGHYAVSRPLAEVAARLDGWAAPRVEVEVSEWALMAYETHDIAGPLDIVGVLSLADGTWSGEAPLTGRVQ